MRNKNGKDINDTDHMFGIVSGCLHLNVRKEPSIAAPIHCLIPRSAEVRIEETESTGEFYKICTASGIEGFCMKKFITVRP